MKEEVLKMTCEEFGALGPAFERAGGSAVEDTQRTAMDAHMQSCARCAALYDSWGELQLRLQALAGETRAAETPRRVELRLRQELRDLSDAHEFRRRRRVFVGLALAAAAVLAVAVAVHYKMKYGTPMSPAAVSPAPQNPQPEIVKQTAPSDAPRRVEALDRPQPRRVNRGAVETASTQEAFSWLPGGSPMIADEASVVRVRMQRAGLGALGLPVNEERAGEWVTVELLVGVDGQPQAVRLLR